LAFCENCGKEVNPGAVVCVNCGHAVGINPPAGAWSSGAMVALVLGSLAIPLVGLGFGFWGRSQPAKKEQATILIVCGLVSWFLACTLLF